MKPGTSVRHQSLQELLATTDIHRTAKLSRVCNATVPQLFWQLSFAESLNVTKKNGLQVALKSTII